jgi:hypothetical protein
MDIALGKDALKKDDPSPKRGKQKGPDKSNPIPVVVKGVPEGEKTSPQAKKSKTTKDTTEKVKTVPDSKESTKKTKTKQSKKGENH